MRFLTSTSSVTSCLLIGGHLGTVEVGASLANPRRVDRIAAGIAIGLGIMLVRASSRPRRNYPLR